MLDIWKHRIARLSDFDKSTSNKYAVMVEETISYMGADYGPPDPPPQMETETLIRMYAFSTEDQVIEWVRQHTDQRYSRPAPFKVFKIEGVSVVTEVKIGLS